jgi:hypothetical protein
LAKQPAKRGVLHPVALNLLDRLILIAEGGINRGDLDAEEREALEAKLTQYRSALHGARAALQKKVDARKAEAGQ